MAVPTGESDVKLFCDANPFCYGSTATLLAILAHLPQADVSVLADGPTLDLCEHLHVLQCDVKNPGSVEQHAQRIAQADVFVAVGNNTNVDLALRLGVPLVFVDTLYWMKRHATAAMLGARTYVIENYPGVEEKLEEMRPERPMRVGPILDVTGPRTERPAGVMASLGGAASPDLIPGRNTHYPDKMTAMLGRLARRLDIVDLPVAMGRSARASVSHAHGVAHPVTLRHDDYVRALRQTGVLVTSPGLNGPLEAFLMGVPVVFLPPQNLTQVHHLAVYEAAGLTAPGRNLPALLPELRFDALAPERLGTRAVVEALGRLSARAWSRIEDLLAAEIQAVTTAPCKQTQVQTTWVRTLGAPGARTAAEAIVEAARCP